MCGPRVSTLHGGHRGVNCWNKHSMQWTGRLTQRHKAAEPARKWRERALSPGPQEQSPKHQGGERTSEPGPWNLRKMEGHQILDLEGAMRLFCPGLQRKMRVDWAQGRGAHTRSWAGKDFFHVHEYLQITQGKYLLENTNGQSGYLLERNCLTL